jgi:hypothetical protein
MCVTVAFAMSMSVAGFVVVDTPSPTVTLRNSSKRGDDAMVANHVNLQAG